MFSRVFIAISLTLFSNVLADGVLGFSAGIVLSENEATGSCSGNSWLTCPTGTGINSNSTNYPSCCGTSSQYYCPSVATGCYSGGCTTDPSFDIICSSGGKTWACQSAYPICGYNGGCYTGTCSCGSCAGPDPCQFMSCGDTCSNCCNQESLICSGPATCKSSTGFYGTKVATTLANPKCDASVDEKSVDSTAKCPSGWTGPIPTYCTLNPCYTTCMTLSTSPPQICCSKTADP